MAISYKTNQTMKKVQYRACLAMIGIIQGTSRKIIFDELGLHPLVKKIS